MRFRQFPADGPACVILPSNGMCADSYATLGTALAARGLDTWAATLPGFDGTPALDDLGLQALIDHVTEAVAERLGEEGILVGHSLGGQLAVWVAAALSPRALVLLEPAVVPSPRLVRLFAGWYRRGAVEVEPGFRNRGPFFRRLHDPEGWPAAAWAVWERNERSTDPRVVPALLAEPGLAGQMPWDRVTAPVTLVRGGSSGAVMRAQQWALARRFADVRCVTLAGAGHWMVDEVDEALAAVIAGAVG